MKHEFWKVLTARILPSEGKKKKTKWAASIAVMFHPAAVGTTGYLTPLLGKLHVKTENIRPSSHWPQYIKTK